MLSVALVTYAGLPELSDDDRLALHELRRRGDLAEPAVWDDPSVRWLDFDRIVLRSVWDYHRRAAQFLDWLSTLEEQGAPLFNPPGLVRSNADKSYLQALAAEGLAVLPTAWLTRGAATDLRRLLEERDWSEAVVKPSVSASAHRTWRTSLASARADQAALDELLADGDALVQPYAPEIGSEGEWSFVFLGGEFSHAVLKRPAPGDFRVQSSFGGTAAREIPPQALLEGACRVVGRMPAACLYARVDGIARAGALVLMELELIEPVLFLGQHPAAPARFAQAIVTAGERAGRPSGSAAARRA